MKDKNEQNRKRRSNDGPKKPAAIGPSLPSKPTVGITRAYVTYKEDQRKASKLNLSNLSPAERAGKGGKSGMARPSMMNAAPKPNLRTKSGKTPMRKGMK